MSGTVVLYVEDDFMVRGPMTKGISRALGLSVIPVASVGDLRTMKAPEGRIVLITDGNLGDGTCWDVIEHLYGLVGLERLGRTVLLLSGDNSPVWDDELEAARRLSLVTERLLKPCTLKEVQDWWGRVRGNFGL